MYLKSTDKLQLTTDTAGDVDILVAFSDLELATDIVTPDVTPTTVTTAATTDILAAPASGFIRYIDNIGIRNVHASLSNACTVLFDRSATAREWKKTTLLAGDEWDWTEGVGWFKSAATPAAKLERILSADATGQNVTTVQPWFPTNGSANVAGATTYKFDGLLALTRTAGTGSHTTSCLFGGTATLTSIQYKFEGNVGETEALLPSSAGVSRVATAVVFKTTSTNATEGIRLHVNGIVRVNLAGTFIPQFQYVGTAPGQTPTIRANSYFCMYPLGTNTYTTYGVWS